MSTILSDIEVFLTDHAMSATTFGKLAMNDRHLVRQLRNGRRIWPETAKKIRDFMSKHRSA